MPPKTLPQKIESYLQSKLPAYLDTLKQMVAINSFTDNPEGVNILGDMTADIFAKLGFTAERVQADNPNFGRHLVLTRPGQAEPERKIGLVSHLDTVYPLEEEIQNNFAWREEGERFYGPGTVDIKGGTVMMYMLLDALKALAPDALDKVAWVLLLNAAEERLPPDFGNLCLERLAGNTLAALVFEGGALRDSTCSLVVTRKGRVEYLVKAAGRSAHAGNRHHSGANAVVQLAHTIQRIAAFTNYDHHLTFNVGTLKGGPVTNRVPHYAEAGVEMRAFSSKVYEEGIAKMLELNGKGLIHSAAGDYACQVEVEVTDRTPPWPGNPRTEFLYSLWEKTTQELGMAAQRENRGGLSDGNYLWHNIPTLDGLGPSGGNAHCSERSSDGSKDQEYVSPASFVPKALLNTMAILKLIGDQ